MTIDEMRAKKAELGLTSKALAEISHVPVSTIEKIFGGSTKAPRKRTIDAIANALAAEARKMKTAFEPPVSPYKGILREEAAAYGSPERKYTLDDYYALPDERRVELIDGVFYDMAAPSKVHQRILGELYILFRECIEQHGKDCEVLFAPFDVRLDRDNYTMVQPDLLVICGEPEEDSSRRLEGPPDLTLEILSPSTRSKDLILKLYKYKNAGVREYWIVDPDHRSVTVHMLQDEDYFPRNYDFEDKIPIGISNGACSIDFSRISDRLKRWGFR